MICFVLALGYAALAALALAMETHHRKIFSPGTSPALRSRLRLAGRLLLAAAFACAIVTQGLALGIVADSVATGTGARDSSPRQPAKAFCLPGRIC